jgi:diacylglycerol kinase family enzyme
MAGRGSARRSVERLQDALAAHSIGCEVEADLSAVAARASAMSEQGRLRAVVGAGGDGTANELLNRLAPGIPVVMLPQGTENLLAKYLQTGRKSDEVAEVIRLGHYVRLDAGRAIGQPLEGGGAPQERLFLLMVSCGFDAEVIVRLHEHRTGPITHWSYVKPILRAMRSYQYPELRVAGETGNAGAAGPLRLAARWVFLFNLPCYAWGLKFAPFAAGSDGLLDLCTFRRGGVLRAAWYLQALLRQRHRRLADCTHGRVTGLVVESREPVYYQLDGEPGGRLPLSVETVPRRATLLVPPRWRDPATNAGAE